MIILTSSAQAAPPDKVPAPSSIEGPYPGFGYPWEHNTLGITDEVPPPWTAIQYQPNQFSVWGRDFTLGRGILPQQITSQCRDLFTNAPTLILQIDGHDISLGRPDVTLRKGNRVEFITQWTGETCDITAHGSLEYDGLWKVTLKITPRDKSMRIDELTLKFPFRSEVARGFSRYLDYDFLDEVVGREDTINSYGDLQKPRAMAFTPTIWIGNRRRGMEWVCETNFGWSLAHRDRAITFQPGAQTTLMTIHVVSKPLTIDSPYSFTFALYPTPIKPLPVDWRQKRLVSGAAVPGRLNTKALDVYGIIWPGVVPLKYPGLPIVEASDSPMYQNPSLPARQQIANPAQRLRDTRALMKKKHVRFIPYGALNFMPARLPHGEWKDYAPYWRVNLTNKGGGTNRTWGRAMDIPKGEITIVHISPAPKSFRDFIVWTYVHAMEKYHLDGLYFDAGAPNVMAINPNLPYAKFVKHGGVYYPFFAERRLMQRLWVACKKRKPDFLITGHNPKMPAIIAGFYDICLTGEALTTSFRSKDWTIQRANTDLSAYVPDYSIFPEAVYALGYTHRAIGTVNMMLPMIIKQNGHLMHTHPALLERYTRTLFARTLAYNIPLYAARMDLKLYTKLNRAFSHFHWLADAHFFGPRHADQFLHRGGHALHVALYLDAAHDQVLMVVSNFHKDAASETIGLNLRQLAARGVDLSGRPQFLNPQTLKPAQLKKGKNGVHLDVPGNDYRLYIIRAEPDATDVLTPTHATKAKQTFAKPPRVLTPGKPIILKPDDTHDDGTIRDTNMDGAGDTFNTKTLEVGDYESRVNSGEIDRGVILFSLPSLPSHQTVASAQLRLYLTHIQGSPVGDAVVYHLSQVQDSSVATGYYAADPAIRMGRLVTPAGKRGKFYTVDVTRAIQHDYAHLAMQMPAAAFRIQIDGLTHVNANHQPDRYSFFDTSRGDPDKSPQLILTTAATP